MSADDVPVEAAERVLTALREVRPSIGYGLASRWEPGDYQAGAVRLALADAGLPVPTGSIEGGGPALPDGVAVSVSHSRGIAVAAAAPVDAYCSVGADVELSEQPGSAAHLALSATEQAWLLDGYAGPARDRRLLEAFSAKESAGIALSSADPRRIAYGVLTWTAIPTRDRSQAPC